MWSCGHPDIAAIFSDQPAEIPRRTWQAWGERCNSSGRESVLLDRPMHYTRSPRDSVRVAKAAEQKPAEQKPLGRDLPMKMSSAIRAALVALTAFAGAALPSAASADEGSVSLVIYKAGWIIGGSGGSGVLNFHGRRYGLSTGGIDYGLVFGGSKTVLYGRVSNIYRPSDVAGVYGAAGAGLAVGRGARGIVLTNQKGAVLELSGQQVGLLANVDLSGLAITMR